MIITNSRYALVGYFMTSYPTRVHGIIAIYCHTNRSSATSIKCSSAKISRESGRKTKQQETKQQKAIETCCNYFSNQEGGCIDFVYFCSKYERIVFKELLFSLAKGLIQFEIFLSSFCRLF